jgi:threonine dehydrogenase-like Zn-dependent dehydrogenase
MVVDTHADRLALAAKLGAIPIDDSDGSSADQVMELTGGEGADRGCECVGYQCSCKGHEVPNATMNNLIKAVRPTGGMGVVGVFVAEDPKDEDALAKKGQLALDFSQLWMKSQHIATS